MGVVVPDVHQTVTQVLVVEQLVEMLTIIPQVVYPITVVMVAHNQPVVLRARQMLRVGPQLPVLNFKVDMAEIKVQPAVTEVVVMVLLAVPDPAVAAVVGAEVAGVVQPVVLVVVQVITIHLMSQVLH